MSVKFYAVLFLSLCMVLILYLLPGPLLGQSLKKSSNFFYEAIEDAQVTVLQCHVSLYIFDSSNNDANRRPLVVFIT